MGLGLLAAGFISLILCFTTSDSYPSGIGWSPFFWLTPICLGAGSVILSMQSQRKQAAKRDEEIQLAKKNYDQALEFLATNPHDPTARIKCLELGRNYYGFTMPDTHTVHYGSTVGTSDHQNNAAGREARINSDIEARLGHLKLRKEA